MDDEPTAEELEYLNLYMYGVAPAKASTSNTSTSKSVIDPLATLNKDASASIDVTYMVVWTAGELPEFWRLKPEFSWMVEELPFLEKEPPIGRIRITDSIAEGDLSSKRQAQDATRSAPTPQPLPEGKIACNAMLHRGTLGALCTCIYDTVTDSFGTFGNNDETWSYEKGYKDYGYIEMSTKKWAQGSWVSVEDDNENEFLFLTVEKDHGIPRVWRPNMVAKRVVGDGETKLSYEEVLRLGLKEDHTF